eukprot:8836263-Ditylum_brightwellii.AAC.1
MLFCICPIRYGKLIIGLLTPMLRGEEAMWEPRNTCRIWYGHMMYHAVVILNIPMDSAICNDWETRCYSFCDFVSALQYVGEVFDVGVHATRCMVINSDYERVRIPFL